ncbi:Prefoldin subunit 6 [Microsporum ferrugineum]
MADAQKQIQALSEEYQKLQTELEEAIAAREKLEAQQQENTSVQKEFKTLDEDANIYKLVGPVLLKQDKTEAVMAVDGRLDFIEKEINRIEKQITEIQEKSEMKKGEIIQLQSRMQQPQAGGAPVAA